MVGGFGLSRRPVSRTTSNVSAADTPLLDASCRHQWKEVRRLVIANVDPNESGYGGQTPLMFAARAGETKLLETLILHGAKAARDGVSPTSIDVQIERPIAFLLGEQFRSREKHGRP